MSDLELYDLALYGAMWRKGECKRNSPEERHYEELIELLTDMLVRAELKEGAA